MTTDYPEIPDFLRRRRGEVVPPPDPMHVSALRCPEPATEPSWRSRWPLTDADRAAIAELAGGRSPEAREEKKWAWTRRVKAVRGSEGRWFPGARWDPTNARWTHPQLNQESKLCDGPVQPGAESVTPAPAATGGHTMAKKAKAKKEPAAPRKIGAPKGKVEDFHPVRAGTARAKVVELGLAGDKTVAQIASRIGKDRKTVLTHLFCLNRDSGIGYDVGEDDRVTVTLPGSKTLEDAIKQPAEAA